MKPSTAIAVLVVGVGLVGLVGWMIARGAADVAKTMKPPADPWAAANN